MRLYGPKNDPGLTKSVAEVAPGHFITNMLHRSGGAPRTPSRAAPVTRTAAAPASAPRVVTVADVPETVRFQIERAAVKGYREEVFAKGKSLGIGWHQLEHLLGG